MERYILKDNEARSRYEFDLGGHTAYIDYEKDNGTIVLTHTFVPEAYEGRGVGAQLVAAVLLKVSVQKPACRRHFSEQIYCRKTLFLSCKKDC